MINYRHAQFEDITPLLDLIEQGFSLRRQKSDFEEGLEHRVLFTYLYSRPGWKPEWVIVAEEQGQLIAAVGVFPQQLSFEGNYLPVWAISPVVTHPEHRGKQAAVKCMEYMLDWLKNLGVPAVFLWGIPNYYPKYGFVPILPRYKTRLTKAQFRGGSEVGAIGNWYSLEAKDLEDLDQLYRRWDKELWLQPWRGQTWWTQRIEDWKLEDAEAKEVPFPKKENFRVWRNKAGKVVGYINLRRDLVVNKVYLTEGAAADYQTANAMIAALRQELSSEWELVINGTPDHLLNRAAYRWGGTNLNPAPLAGMIKVIDWPNFLGKLEPVFLNRIRRCWENPKINLQYQIADSCVNFQGTMDHFRADFSGLAQVDRGEFNLRLTRIILGLYQDDDLNGFSGEAKERYLPGIFPHKFPFIWDANYLY